MDLLLACSRLIPGRIECKNLDTSFVFVSFVLYRLRLIGYII